MKALLLCVAIAAAFMSSNLSARSVWEEGSLYTPPENLNQGETLIVEVQDLSRMRYNLDVENSKSSTVSANPDASITAYLPNVSSNKDITHADGVKVESRGTLSLRVATAVGNRQNDGSYAINGTKTLIFNGVATTVAITGRVHPKSVNGNSVRSDQVINFRLTVNTTTQGLGLNLDRQLGEEDSASAELTEQEKQQIITDYLEKIIDELSK